MTTPSLIHRRRLAKPVSPKVTPSGAVPDSASGPTEYGGNTETGGSMAMGESKLVPPKSEAIYWAKYCTGIDALASDRALDSAIFRDECAGMEESDDVAVFAFQFPSEHIELDFLSWMDGKPDESGGDSRVLLTLSGDELRKFERHLDRSAGGLGGLEESDSRASGGLAEAVVRGTMNPFIAESCYTRLASSDAQERAINKVCRLIKAAGCQVMGATTIGKSPQTVILDLKHHGSDIYINPAGRIDVGDEENLKGDALMAAIQARCKKPGKPEVKAEVPDPTSKVDDEIDADDDGPDPEEDDDSSVDEAATRVAGDLLQEANLGVSARELVESRFSKLSKKLGNKDANDPDARAASIGRNGMPPEEDKDVKAFKACEKARHALGVPGNEDNALFARSAHHLDKVRERFGARAARALSKSSSESALWGKDRDKMAADGKK